MTACGNALYPDEVLGGVLAQVGLAKACITDPPYNVPTSGHTRTLELTEIEQRLLVLENANA